MRRIPERMCAMVARILVVNLVWLKDVRRKALKSIPHEYSDEMSQKSHVVSISSDFSSGVYVKGKPLLPTFQIIPLIYSVYATMNGFISLPCYMHCSDKVYLQCGCQYGYLNSPFMKGIQNTILYGLLPVWKLTWLHTLMCLEKLHVPHLRICMVPLWTHVSGKTFVYCIVLTCVSEFNEYSLINCVEANLISNCNMSIIF